MLIGAIFPLQGAYSATSSTAATESAQSTKNASQIAAAVPQDGIRPSTEGFYPIWENTGFVEKHRELYIGTNGAHYGIQDVAHVGVTPVNFLYRAPNAYVKFSAYQGERWHVSGQVGAYYLMDEASRAFLSPMYASRLDNPDFSVWLTPVTATATYELSDWLQLHQTATVLGVLSSADSPLQNQAFVGYTLVGELLAKRRHSVLAHAGEVGFWNHDFRMLGISYRYHNTWLELRLGYFYRFRVDGAQSAPMISVGFLI
jgi:hypothetical protein